MLNLKISSTYKRDLKKFRHNKKVLDISIKIVSDLRNGAPLAVKHRDHSLTGNWVGFRECHLQPDCLLVYRVDADELLLARIGNHAEIFG